MLNHSAMTCRLQWHDVAPRGMLYLESFNSFLSPGGGHDSLLYAGGGLQGPLAAQWARGWRGCQGANRGCGEMARALVLWGYQVSILIVLNVFEVWADSKREREVGQGGDKTWNERNKIERQERGRNGDRESGVGMGGGTKGGKTNVRHTLYRVKTNAHHNSYRKAVFNKIQWVHSSICSDSL